MILTPTVVKRFWDLGCLCMARTQPRSSALIGGQKTLASAVLSEVLDKHQCLWLRVLRFGVPHPQPVHVHICLFLPASHFRAWRAKLLRSLLELCQDICRQHAWEARTIHGHAGRTHGKRSKKVYAEGAYGYTNASFARCLQPGQPLSHKKRACSQVTSK